MWSNSYNFVRAAQPYGVREPPGPAPTQERFGAKAFNVENRLIRMDLYCKENGRETIYQECSSGAWSFRGRLRLEERCGHPQE
jgi:hypothetical protein